MPCAGRDEPENQITAWLGSMRSNAMQASLDYPTHGIGEKLPDQHNSSQEHDKQSAES
jgi:hypothetical protein